MRSFLPRQTAQTLYGSTPRYGRAAKALFAPPRAHRRALELAEPVAMPAAPLKPAPAISASPLAA